MASNEDHLITRCDELRAGDTIEAWVGGHRFNRGTVTETVPGMGLFWICEEPLGERRLLDMSEVDVVRVPDVIEPGPAPA